MDDRGRESQMPKVSAPAQDNSQKRLEALPKYPASYKNPQFGPMNRGLPPPDRWTPNDMAMRRIQNMMEQRLRLIDMIERKMKAREQKTTRPPVPQSPVGKLFPTVRKFITVSKSVIQPRKLSRQNKIPQVPNNTPLRHQPVQQIPMIPKPQQQKPQFIVAQKKQFVQVPRQSIPQFSPVKQATHIRINVPNAFPYIPHHPSMRQRGMPQIPDMHAQRFHNRMPPIAPMHKHIAPPRSQFPNVPPHPMALLLQRIDQDRVQLPKFPVQMPPVQVQPGPSLGKYDTLPLF